MSLYLPPELRWLGWIAGAQWPDGDEDKAWEVAAAWQDASKELFDLLARIDAAEQATMEAYPEGDARTEMGARYDMLRSGDQSLEQLATSMEAQYGSTFDMGTELQALKLTIIVTLCWLALEIAWAWLFPPTAPAVEAAAIASTRSYLKIIQDFVQKTIQNIARRAGAPNTKRHFWKELVKGNPGWPTAKGWGVYGARAAEGAIVPMAINGSIQAGQIADGKRRSFNGQEFGLSALGGAAGAIPAREFGRYLGEAIEKVAGKYLNNLAGRTANGMFIGAMSDGFGAVFGNAATAAVTGDPGAFTNAPGWVGNFAQGALVGGARGASAFNSYVPKTTDGFTDMSAFRKDHWLRGNAWFLPKSEAGLFGGGSENKSVVTAGGDTPNTHTDTTNTSTNSTGTNADTTNTTTAANTTTAGNNTTTAGNTTTGNTSTAGPGTTNAGPGTTNTGGGAGGTGGQHGSVQNFGGNSENFGAAAAQSGGQQAAPNWSNTMPQSAWFQSAGESSNFGGNNFGSGTAGGTNWSPTPEGFGPAATRHDEFGAAYTDATGRAWDTQQGNFVGPPVGRFWDSGSDYEAPVFRWADSGAGSFIERPVSPLTDSDAGSFIERPVSPLDQGGIDSAAGVVSGPPGLGVNSNGPAPIAQPAPVSPQNPSAQQFPAQQAAPPGTSQQSPAAAGASSSAPQQSHQQSPPNSSQPVPRGGAGPLGSPAPGDGSISASRQQAPPQPLGRPPVGQETPQVPERSPLRPPPPPQHAPAPPPGQGAPPQVPERSALRPPVGQEAPPVPERSALRPPPGQPVVQSAPPPPDRPAPPPPDRSAPPPIPERSPLRPPGDGAPRVPERSPLRPPPGQPVVQGAPPPPDRPAPPPPQHAPPPPPGQGGPPPVPERSPLRPAPAPPDGGGPVVNRRPEDPDWLTPSRAAPAPPVRQPPPPPDPAGSDDGSRPVSPRPEPVPDTGPQRLLRPDRDEQVAHRQWLREQVARIQQHETELQVQAQRRRDLEALRSLHEHQDRQSPGQRELQRQEGLESIQRQQVQRQEQQVDLLQSLHDQHTTGPDRARVQEQLDRQREELNRQREALERQQEHLDRLREQGQREQWLESQLHLLRETAAHAPPRERPAIAAQANRLQRELDGIRQDQRDRMPPEHLRHEQQLQQEREQRQTAMDDLRHQIAQTLQQQWNRVPAGQLGDGDRTRPPQMWQVLGVQQNSVEHYQAARAWFDENRDHHFIGEGKDVRGKPRPQRWPMKVPYPIPEFRAPDVAGDDWLPENAVPPGVDPGEQPPDDPPEPPVIHPEAKVDPGATIGSGAQVEAGAVVGDGARIGEGAVVHSGASVESDAVIGAGTILERGVVVHPGAQVGKDVVVGEGAVIPAGAAVPDGTVVPPGEVFGGTQPGSASVDVPFTLK
ncbi:hypothetical protein [Nocardia carnea]|uniref:WXG100-like domain-containing protein n=1 Tax=Nocardia carnea TaxID=37328 RepID=UPI0024542DB3|nr:hypothetical protein [Nocardia carnea]